MGAPRFYLLLSFKNKKRRHRRHGHTCHIKQTASQTNFLCVGLTHLAQDKTSPCLSTSVKRRLLQYMNGKAVSKVLKYRQTKPWDRGGGVHGRPVTPPHVLPGWGPVCSGSGSQPERACLSGKALVIQTGTPSRDHPFPHLAGAPGRCRPWLRRCHSDRIHGRRLRREQSREAAGWEAGSAERRQMWLGADAGAKVTDGGGGRRVRN